MSNVKTIYIVISIIIIIVLSCICGKFIYDNRAGDAEYSKLTEESRDTISELISDNDLLIRKSREDNEAITSLQNELKTLQEYSNRINESNKSNEQTNRELETIADREAGVISEGQGILSDIKKELDNLNRIIQQIKERAGN